MSGTVTIGDYVVTRHLGAGSFATVYKGHHRETNDVVAIKAISLRRLDRKSLENLESEISIMRRVKHHNIVRMLDVQKSEKFIYLILEYCGGGDLSRLIRKQGPLPEKRAQGLMKQLAAGLYFLWANNLIHRDLKPQNLLLTSDGPDAVLKIADFGFARHLAQATLAETLCGSPLYMAPEILRYQKYDAKADLWSVGAILFEMVAKRPPFTGSNPMELLQNIERQELRLPEGLVVTAPCLELLRGLLTRNPHMRISFQDFFASPFIDVSAKSMRAPEKGGAGAKAGAGAGSGQGVAAAKGAADNARKAVGVTGAPGTASSAVKPPKPPPKPVPGASARPVTPAADAAGSNALLAAAASGSTAGGSSGTRSAASKSGSLGKIGSDSDSSRSGAPSPSLDTSSVASARSVTPVKTPPRKPRRHTMSTITTPVVPSNLNLFGVQNTAEQHGQSMRGSRYLAARGRRRAGPSALHLAHVPHVFRRHGQATPSPTTSEGTSTPRHTVLPPPPLPPCGTGIRRSASANSLSSAGRRRSDGGTVTPSSPFREHVGSGGGRGGMTPSPHHHKPGFASPPRRTVSESSLAEMVSRTPTKTTAQPGSAGATAPGGDVARPTATRASPARAATLAHLSTSKQSTLSGSDDFVMVSPTVAPADSDKFARPAPSPDRDPRRPRQLQHRDLVTLRRAVDVAHEMGLRASAVVELAYQVDTLRVDPLSSDASDAAKGVDLGFGVHPSIIQYVDCQMTEASVVRRSRVQALCLYVKALDMLYSGVLVRQQVPAYLLQLSKSPRSNTEASAGDTHTQQLLSQWSAVDKWLQTCLSRCMALADACSESLKDDAATQTMSVCAEELLYRRAMNVGAQAAAHEARVREEVAQLAGGQLATATQASLQKRVRSVGASYLHASRLLSVIVPHRIGQRVNSLPALDRERVLAMWQELVRRREAVQALEARCTQPDGGRASARTA